MNDAERIQDALRAMAGMGRELVPVPPFTAAIDPLTALTFLNYAIPDRGARDWPGESIGALISTFRERGRTPRLEVVEACWPGLVPALERHGFVVEHRLLGLACAPGGLVGAPPPPGVTLEPVLRAADGALVREFLDLGISVFADEEPAEPWEPTGDADVAVFREAGAEGVIARDPQGGAIGRAAWIRPQLGVAEIVGVGVVPEHRRRGIAGAMTAAASAAAFAAGADLAFLTPGSDGAARVYARAGFTPSVQCVHLAASRD